MYLSLPHPAALPPSRPPSLPTLPQIKYSTLSPIPYKDVRAAGRTGPLSHFPYPIL